MLAKIFVEKIWFRALMHLLYWILAWFFLNLLFGYGELWNRLSLCYSFVILLITAGATYWIIGYLIPRYLFTGRYGLFLIYLLFTIIVSLDLELITVMVGVADIAQLENALTVVDDLEQAPLAIRVPDLVERIALAGISDALEASAIRRFFFHHR